MPIFILGKQFSEEKSEKKSLEQYLNFTIQFNKKVKNLEEFRVASGDIAATESMLAGTTTLCASRNWELAQKYGFREIAFYPLMKTKKTKSFLKNIQSQYDFIKKEDTSTITTGLFLHSLPYVDRNLLKTTRLLMNQGKISCLTVHAGESEKEVAKTIKLYGKRPIEVLDEYGLVNKKTLLVHCIYLSANEKKIILRKKPAICLCPVSNLKLGKKLPDLKFFLDNNLRLCLGTDGLATGDSASLLSVARLTGILFNHPKLDEKKLLSLIT